MLIIPEFTCPEDLDRWVRMHGVSALQNGGPLLIDVDGMKKLCCRRCNDEILPARLVAHPNAVCCVPCQEVLFMIDPRGSINDRIAVMALAVPSGR